MPADTYSNDDIIAALKNSPGKYIELPNVTRIGVADPLRAMTNFSEIASRCLAADRAGFAIEALSLRLAFIEFWLRAFVVAKNQDKTFDSTDKSTFGVILADAQKLGLDKELCATLTKFNSDRINAVHKYILGAASYDEIVAASNSYVGLPSRVQRKVLSAIGRPIADIEEFSSRMGVGSMIFGP